MAKLRILPYHPSSIAIDGQHIRIRVARFDIDQLRDVSKDYQRFNDPPSERPLAVRKPGVEQEKRPRVRPRTPVEIRAAEALEQVRTAFSVASIPEGPPFDVDETFAAIAALIPAEATDEVFVIPMSEIRERRLADMTPEQRADWERQDADDEAFSQDLIVRVVSQFVTVEEGEIEIEDADGVRNVTTGRDLLRLYGGRRDVLSALMSAVWHENTLDASLKNVWRSVSGSGSSSAGPDQEAAGARPGPTATSAGPEASATTAAVMGSIEEPSSGSMATSS